MLKTVLRARCALVATPVVFATIVVFAGAAWAEDHAVMIVDGSYFPSTIYAQPGDTITFTNASATSHTVVGPEESWTSGPIMVDGSFQLDLTEETPLTFSNGGSEGSLTEGEISFDPAPLAD